MDSVIEKENDSENEDRVTNEKSVTAAINDIIKEWSEDETVECKC